MRPTTVFYSRYLPKPNDLGMKKGEKRPTGSHAICLYMIAAWWGEEEGGGGGAGAGVAILGKPFTAAEFIARFQEEAENLWEEPGTSSSTLKVRLAYLYEGGYLAKTTLGAKNWFITTRGQKIAVPTKAELEAEKANLPSAAEIIPLNIPPEQVTEEEDSYEDEFRKILKDQGFID